MERLKQRKETPAELFDIEKLKKRFKRLKVKGDTAIHTPFDLIDEQLSKIPDSEWSNPDYKIVDQTCGKGTFLIIAYNKLFLGLKSIIKDDRVRRNHILNSMLYGADVDEISCMIARQALYGSSSIEGNIKNVNSLEHNWSMKFDIVLGNLPFQAPKKSDKVKMGGGTSIWHKVMGKVFDIAKDDGYIAIIHPSNWRKVGATKCNYLKDYQINYLSINSAKTSKEVFGIAAKYDWYVLKNTKKNTHTIISDEFGNEVSHMIEDTIPNFAFDIFDKFKELALAHGGCTAYSNRETNSYDKHVSKEKDTEFKYTIFKTHNKKGLEFMYSSKKPSIYNKKKVVFSESISSKAYYCDTCGVGQGVFYIEVESDTEGKMVEELMNSNIGKIFSKMFNLRTFARHPECFRYLPKMKYNDIIKYLTPKQLEQIKHI